MPLPFVILFGVFCVAIYRFFHRKFIKHVTKKYSLSDQSVKGLSYKWTVNQLQFEKTYSLDSGVYEISVRLHLSGFFLQKKMTQILVGSPGALPNVFLDSTNKRASLYDSKHKKVKGFQRISLEGDVDTSFAVYVPGSARIESLQFLTPDVLIFFRDHFPNFDILIYGGTIDMRRAGIDRPTDHRKDYRYLIQKIDRIYRYWSTQEKTDSLKNRLET